MAIINRDGNRRTNKAGVNLSDLVTPLQFHFDPVTNRLLVDVTITSNSSSVIPTLDKHDGNRVPTAYGVIDGTDTLRPFMIDNTNNYLFVDITFT